MLVSYFLVSLYYVLEVIVWLLLIRALISWIPKFAGGKFSEFLAMLTEPVIAPIRAIINRTPLGGGMLDFSFLITFFVITIIQEIIASNLI